MPKQDEPNIVFILADTVRHAILGLRDDRKWKAAMAGEQQERGAHARTALRLQRG